MTVLGSLTHSPSFVALHSVSHVPWLISPSSLWRRLSVSYTVSFPQSLVPGPFSSPMKSYLSGCLISPRLQSLYTHDPQSFISRTAQSSVWEPNDCCLLDTSLKFHKYLRLQTFKMKLPSSQNPCSSCDALLLQWTGWSVLQAKNLDVILDSSLSITLTIYSVAMPCAFCLLLECIYFSSTQRYCSDLWSHHLLHELL